MQNYINFGRFFWPSGSLKAALFAVFFGVFFSVQTKTWRDDLPYVFEFWVVIMLREVPMRMYSSLTE